MRKRKGGYMRRTKGTGSIVRRPNGRFKATITVSGGKRVSKTFDTREECQKFFMDIKGKDVKYFSPVTVAEYYEHFMELKSGVYRESTLNGLKQFYRKHVENSKVAHIKFSDLTPQDINRFFLGLSSKGYASSTLDRWRKNFKAILETAVLEGYLENNPMESRQAIRRLKGRQERQKKVFSLEEVQKLLSIENLSTLPVVYQVYIVLSFITGARPQEILALTREDIKEDKVSFNKSLGFQGKLQETMKTPTSIREVPIETKWGLWLLDKIEKKTVSIFRSEKSTYGYLSKDNVNVRFKKYVEVVLGSSKGHHLYDTRHTYATLLITVFHVDVKTVSMLMGHSNIETTLKYYTHSFPTCHMTLPV